MMCARLRVVSGQWGQNRRSPHSLKAVSVNIVTMRFCVPVSDSAYSFFELGFAEVHKVDVAT